MAPGSQSTAAQIRAGHGSGAIDGFLKLQTSHGPREPSSHHNPVTCRNTPACDTHLTARPGFRSSAQGVESLPTCARDGRCLLMPVNIGRAHGVG